MHHRQVSYIDYLQLQIVLTARHCKIIRIDTWLPWLLDFHWTVNCWLHYSYDYQEIHPSHSWLRFITRTKWVSADFALIMPEIFLSKQRTVKLWAGFLVHVWWIFYRNTKRKILLNLPEPMFQSLCIPVLYLDWMPFFYYGCKINISRILSGQKAVILFY